MRRVLDTLGGLWELLIIGLRYRGRLRGPYWRWRMETAFGSDPARRPPRRQRWRAMLDFARWSRRMKREMRASSR